MKINCRVDLNLLEEHKNSRLKNDTHEQWLFTSNYLKGWCSMQSLWISNYSGQVSGYLFIISGQQGNEYFCRKLISFV